jgi:uncharacterized membrane protein HdeD (DUF308 family)
MASPEIVSMTGIHLVGVETLRKSWSRFVGLGILLVILGTLAVGFSVLTTLATMVFIGWLTASPARTGVGSLLIF